MMEVRSEPELTMDGSKGCGGLDTVDHHFQKWVSLPQKGKVVDGGHFPSRDLAITRSDLSKKGSFCASGVNADPAVDDAITGQASRACRALESVYDDPAGTNSNADAASGTNVAAVTSEILGCVAQDTDGAAVAIYEGLSSDLRRSDSDLVKPESCKQVSPLWATIIGASSDEDENAGKVFCFDNADEDKVFPAGEEARDNAEGQSKVHSVVDARSHEDEAAGKPIRFDTAVADTVFPSVEDAMDNNESQPNVAGKSWRANVAGSGVGKMGPARAWGKKGPAIGPVLSSGIAGPATAGNQTRMVVGPSTNSIPATSDQRSSFPQRPGSDPCDEMMHPEVSFLGLGAADFPPLRPLTVVGKSKVASVYKEGSDKTKTSVKASTNTVPTSRQSVQMVSSTDKKVFGKGRGAPATVMQSDEAKISHNWRSLFVNRPKSCSPLAFYNPTTVDGKVTINPPPEAVVEGVGLWEGSLVGQFFDKRLPLHVVRSFIERLWGKHEIPEISTTDNGLYIFRFKDLDARDWVLENGPWYLAGRPIILRFWKPGMEMLNVQITSLPIWVKFFNIPLEYWTVTSLGYIASAVGIPLHLDTLTENHSRLSYARICIEVDVNCTFPNTALLALGNGTYSTIRIEYPWVPQKCDHCKIFGHNLVKCPSGKKMAVPKKTTCPDHIAVRLAKDYIGATDPSPVSIAVNAVDGIINHTIPGKTGNVQNTDIQGRLTGNTFECLAICDDASNLEESVDQNTAVVSVTTTPNLNSTLSGLGSLESSKLDLSNLADFSDTSPICETFKHIKGVDELDYLPLSKKKLKKLRKQNHAIKSAKSSSCVDTLSPYIVDID